METIYIICAAVGGTLLVCQFLMGLLGMGEHHDAGDHGGDVHGADHDHDQDHDHDKGTSLFIGLLTFRTIVAALTFFGLAGMAGTERGLDAPIALLVALAAGGGALFLVAWMMRTLHGLKAEGTAHIDRSVGKNGTVYLRIPGQKAGTGKVHLNLQNRTVEYQAITSKDELPTGAKVVVVSVINSDTVEVAPAIDSERSNHV